MGTSNMNKLVDLSLHTDIIDCKTDIGLVSAITVIIHVKFTSHCHIHSRCLRDNRGGLDTKLYTSINITISIIVSNIL